MPKNVTVQVGDELVAKMEKLPDVNWSQVIRDSIEKYCNSRLTPPPPKGELIEGLENYVSEKLPTTEDIEKARKEEIERFTRKWGKEDPRYTNYTKLTHPYVKLAKRHEVKYGDQTIARLYINNNRELAKGLIKLDEKGSGKYDKELYPQEIANIVDYFKSKGFTVVEESFIQPQIMMFVLDTYGSKGRELARDLASKGYHYFGLFATDKEDEVFIAYREARSR